MTLYEFLNEHESAKIEVSEYGRPLAMFNNEKIRQYEETIREDERAKVVDLIDRLMWTYSKEVWEDFQPNLKKLKEQI